MKLVWVTALFTYTLAAPLGPEHDTSKQHKLRDTKSDFLPKDLSNHLYKEKIRLKKSTNPVRCYTVYPDKREPYSLCSDGSAAAAAAAPPRSFNGLDMRWITPQNRAIFTTSNQIPRALKGNIKPKTLSSPSPDSSLLKPQPNYQGTFYPLSGDFGREISAALYGYGRSFTGSPYCAYGIGSKSTNQWLEMRRRHLLERSHKSGQIEIDFPQSEPFYNVIPTLPLPGGLQVRTSSGGVWPKTVNGCGRTSFIINCIPTITRGTLV